MKVDGLLHALKIIKIQFNYILMKILGVSCKVYICLHFKIIFITDMYINLII